MCRTLLSAGMLLLSFRATVFPQTRETHAVGFRVFERVDASRYSKDFPMGRPVQISYWYPAASASPPLAFGDYAALSATETAFEGQKAARAAAETRALQAYEAFLGQVGVSPAEGQMWLATPMRAARNAPPAADRAPLVLIAQGNGESAADQAFLAELLASRGYAVATTPSQAKIDGPMKSEEDIPAQAMAQAADLAFAARIVREEGNVRPGRYALVAHSFGARSALLLAMSDSDAVALVSLDGGIGAARGKGLLEKVKGYDRARVRVPILHLWEEGDPFMTPDFDLLRSLRRSERWLVRVDGMRHVHFSTTGVMVRSLPSVATRTSANARTAAAWDAVAETTASFLDRFLRDASLTRGPRAVAWKPPESALLHAVRLPRS